MERGDRSSITFVSGGFLPSKTALVVSISASNKFGILLEVTGRRHNMATAITGSAVSAAINEEEV